MPVRFEAPQPLDPATSINAGRAQVMQQNMGVLAQMYDRANQLAAQLSQNRQAPVYMNSGGGRSSSGGESGRRGYDGAPLGAVMGLNAEYDRQARKQSQMGREDLLRLQYGLEGDERRRQEQMLQGREDAWNQSLQQQQQPKAESPPEWTPADERDLQYHQNAVRQAQQEYSAGYIDEPQRQEHLAWIEEQRQPLLTRKQEFEAYQQSKQVQNLSQAKGVQDQIQNTSDQQTITAARVPGVSPGPFPGTAWMRNPATGNQPVLIQRDRRTGEYKVLELDKHADQQIKIEESRVKMQQTEVEHYFKMREGVQQAELKFQNDQMAREKKETQDQKSKRKFDTREYTSEELEDQVQQTMRRMGLPPTPAEFMDQQAQRWGRRGQRGSQGPTVQPRREPEMAPIPSTASGQQQAALDRIQSLFSKSFAPTPEPVLPAAAQPIRERRDFSRHK